MNLFPRNENLSKQSSFFIRFFFTLTLLSFAGYLYLFLGARFAQAAVAAIVVCLSAAITIILLQRYLTTYRFIWVMLTILISAWLLADIIIYYRGADLSATPFLQIIVDSLYFLPKLSILGTVIYYFISYQQKWNRLQTIADLLIILVVNLIIIVQIFIAGPQSRGLVLPDFVNQIPGLFINYLVFVIFIYQVFSSRARVFSASQLVLSLGMLCFLVTDVTYLYQVIYDHYEPNSFLNVLYYISFVFFITAAYIELHKKTKSSELFFYHDDKRLDRIALGLFLEGTVVLLFILGLLPGFAFVRATAIIIIYLLVNRLILFSIKNERFFQMEKAFSTDLEAQIKKRTAELQLLNEELIQQAITDPLTGMYSRIYFLNKLDELINNGTESFSLIYIDFKRFHSINNMHGNVMGDKVLKELAKRST